MNTVKRLKDIMKFKSAIVCGAGGFIGGHLVKDLLKRGYKVVAVDIKPLKEWFQLHEGALNEEIDLRDTLKVNFLICNVKPDELYQLAADMGGAGFVFTGEHDADIMHNSATINLNISNAVATLSRRTKVFYSSSACIYPKFNQVDPDNPNCREDTAYPAQPDSEYGWEKLFSERMWRAYARNYGLQVRIARFHNIFGSHGSWNDGKEKAPAAICRKVAMSTGEVEIWGPGTQTRSFLYIDECLEGVQRLMDSDVETIINIGSDEMISITALVQMVAEISGKVITIKNIDGPVGVNGRNSNNVLIEELLGWAPSIALEEGIQKLYYWIEQEIANTVSLQ